MVKKEVFFQTMSDIQNFNKIAFRCDYDVDLQQGKYLVDAKSIMGIFSMDVGRPLMLVLHTEKEEELLKFQDYFKEEIEG
ncbi:MAG: HPr family phosphocarrier protein [Clostridiales bacterium]|nr:HPr family phosphocarrier protein [Clostridiales bacterium]